MAMTLAELVVKVVGEDRGATATLRSVNREVDKTEQSAHRMGKGMQMAAGISAAALAGMATFALKAVNDASDLSEAANKASNTFGAAAKTIPGFSSSVAKSLGLSRAQALDMAGSLGAMTQAMGQSRAESAKTSTQVLKLAADLGSFHNVDTADMLDRLQSGLSGEMEPLKKFGILVSDARVQTEAMRLGLVKYGKDGEQVKAATLRMDLAQQKYTEAVAKHGKGSAEAQRAQLGMMTANKGLEKSLQGTKIPLDENAKLQARLSIITRDAAVANNDFAETSGGLANQQKIVAAQVTDLAATFGGALLPAVAGALGGLIGLVSFVQENATVFGVLGTVVAGVASAIIAYTAYVKAAAVVTAVWNAILAANPFVLIAALLIGLGVALVIAYKKSETFRDIVNGAFNAVKAVALTVANFITDTLPAAFNKVLSWVKANWPIIATIISGPFAPLVALATDAFGIRSALTGALGKVVSVVKSALSQIPVIVGGIVSMAYNAARGVGAAIASGIAAGLQAMAGWLRDQAVSLATGILDAAKGALGIRSPSKRAAEEVGKPIVQGIAQGMMTNRGLLTAAAVQTVREALAAAKGEARNASSAIAGVLGQVIDERSATKIAAVDNSPEAARLKAIEAAQKAAAKAAEMARLHEAMSNASTDDERQSAVKALNEWLLDQERQTLSDQLAARRQAISDEAATRKAAAERQLADLTETFNRGLIGQKEYTKSVQAILAAEGANFRSVGQMLGAAVAWGFQDSLEALSKFVRGITRNSGTLGGTLGLPDNPLRRKPPAAPKLTGVARFGKDTMVQAHPGETLLTAREAADWRGGGRGVTVNLTVTGNTMLADAPEVADRLARIMQPALSRLVYT
jgi:hypothetical protein